MTEPELRGSNPTDARHHRAAPRATTGSSNGHKWFTSRRGRRGVRHRHGGDQPRAGAPHVRASRSSCRPTRRASTGAQHRRHGRAGRRSTSRTRELRFEGRARAGGEPARARGRGLSDRAGAARARAHPSLHALDRHLRARLRAHVRARGDARDRRRARRSARQQIVQAWIAESRAEIDAARLMVLHAAWTHRAGRAARGARDEISLIKFFVAGVLRARARSRDPGARRARHDRRHAAGLVVPPRARRAHLRRPGRGAQDRRRQAHLEAARYVGDDALDSIDPARAVRAGEELDARLGDTWRMFLGRDCGARVAVPERALEPHVPR